MINKFTAKKYFKRTTLAIFIAATTSQVAAENSLDKVKQNKEIENVKKNKVKQNKEIETITVTGVRSSLGKALNVKRWADSIVDVISAEDIGQMPDPDIGDSLQRVTGVQITRDRGGVAGDVNIRGLPSNFTRVLYNGRNITTATTSNGRSFSFGSMPSAFVKRAEVHKTSMADIAEGGIAGTVVLRSQRAFDIGKKVIRLSVKSRIDENSGEPGHDISAIFSDLYFDDTFGLTLGVNQNRQYSDEESGSASANISFKESNGKDFNNDGDFDDTLISHKTNTLKKLLATRERDAYFINAEYRPNDSFKLFGELYEGDYLTKRNRARIIFDKTAKTNPVAEDMETLMFNDAEFISVFHGTNVGVQTTSNRWLMDSDLLVATLEGEYSTDYWNFRLGTSLAESKMTQHTMGLYARHSPMDLTIDQSSPDFAYIRFTDPLAAQEMLLNVDNYSLNKLQGGIGASREANKKDINFDVVGELDYTFFDALTFEAIKFGINYSESEARYDKRTLSMGYKLLNAIGVENWDYNIIEGDGVSWLSPDSNAFFSNFTDDQLKEAGKYTDVLGDLLEEDVLAAYLRFDFVSANGDLSGNVGVRYVETDQVSTGKGADLEAGFLDDGSGEDGALGIISVHTEDLASRSRTYDNWLPSLNLRYQLSDDMLVRFGASRTMSRPEKHKLSVAAKVSITDDEELLVKTNDPDLDPYLSDNLDLIYSWYFTPESLFAVGLFYKDLKSLIETTETRRNYNITNTVTGETRLEEFILRGYSNRESVNIKGVELTFQQPFSFLPGWLADTGIKTNYTYIDNSASDVLRSASKNNFNVVLYYSKKKLNVRLAYTYRDEYLVTPEVGVTPEEYRQGVEYLTASMTYKLNKNFRLSLAATNLTEESRVDYHANGFNRDFSDNGRRFTLGLTASF